MKIAKRITALLILAAVICFAIPVLADEVTTADTETTQTNKSVVEIYSYNDLLKIREDPAGTYKLMADIDLSEVIWEPLDFQGTFDGNGYAILNATINQVTSHTRKTYDGNRIEYDTCFSGFFGILEDATVSNLKLLGIKTSVKTDDPCFAGGVAGFLQNSRISDVEVSGEVSLYTTGECFGVGGIAGFGNGEIENSVSDMTLICVDQDADNLDEQFMGGAYAAGYIDLNKNEIGIHGYDSDHGYVHNGGLVGMYILYQNDEEYQGYITNNKVTGGISFFEDNEDRRAYCEPFIGEVMNWTFVDNGNEEEFAPDEHFEYDVDLMPHYCDAPTYQDVITPATHTDYGYTTHNCTICGEYSYVSDYTAPEHVVEEWTITTEPTDTEEGIQQGSCTECGAVVFERIPKVASGTPELETTEAADAPAKEASSSGKIILIVVIVIVVLIVLWLLYVRARKARIRKAKAARRAAQRRAAQRSAGKTGAAGTSAGQNRKPQSRRPQSSGTQNSRRPQQNRKTNH